MSFTDTEVVAKCPVLPATSSRRSRVCMSFGPMPSFQCDVLYSLPNEFDAKKGQL